MPHIDVHRMNIETGRNVEKISQLPQGSNLTNAKRKYPMEEVLIKLRPKN